MSKPSSGLRIPQYPLSPDRLQHFIFILCSATLRHHIAVWYLACGPLCLRQKLFPEPDIFQALVILLFCLVPALATLNAYDILLMDDIYGNKSNTEPLSHLFQFTICPLPRIYNLSTSRALTLNFLGEGEGARWSFDQFLGLFSRLFFLNTFLLILEEAKCEGQREREMETLL